MNMRLMITAWTMRMAGAVPGLVMASILGLSPSAFPAGMQSDSQESTIRESVVKISATMRYPDLTHPWSKQSPRDASGTGVVIDGKRILTNAHVVLYASQLFVESNQSSDKLPAHVEAVSPDIDLALLRLEDESFFDKRPPIPRSPSLPEIKENVVVYGYPQGGSTLSVTKGIVSRIEFTQYGSSLVEGTMGLRVQVDAAINPGNSGGPALIEGKMVGLIFSKLSQSDNIGYIIPSEEIDIFLKDVADHKYDGKPAMHDVLQTLENDALRSFLGLDKKIQGLVVRAAEIGNPEDPLKPFDLITKIGKHEIDNVGMIKIRDNLRLDFHYMIQHLVKDGKVPLTIVRQGKTQTIEMPVRTKRPALIEPLKGRYPSYFVYGPLVFSPVTSEFAAAIGGRGMILVLIRSPIVTRRVDPPRFEGEELVVVTSPMFPHRLGKGYDNPLSKVVQEVNGVPVKNLRHFVELLRDSKQKYTTIRFDDRQSETIVFDHQEALRATEEILSDNGIRQQCSDDLASVWAKKK
jgi:S1-C subfamily serine protease